VRRKFYRIPKASYRSGLEDRVSSELAAAGVGFEYETAHFRYKTPAQEHTYTPDFWLPAHNLIVETKGRFVAADRKKHLLVRERNPHVDIRFVFQRSSTPINKGSKTTYAMWCEKNGFKYADKSIPQEWLQ
jgi:hypothetical protein